MLIEATNWLNYTFLHLFHIFFLALYIDIYTYFFLFIHFTYIYYSFLIGRHITDVSSASATGLFDPFTMKWATWILSLLKIPSHVFPEIVDTITNFGVTPKHIFGVEIPIVCCVRFKNRDFLFEMDLYIVHFVLFFLWTYTHFL